MPVSNHYQCIVVGAGIEGSSTAYNLAKNGQKTLLLEKFILPHTRGSSHGPSRGMRKLYVENPSATALMEDAYTMWHDLEAECGRQLIRITGRLWLGQKDDSSIATYASALNKAYQPYETLSATQVSQRYPQLEIPNDWMGLMDPEAGLIYASRALETFQQLFTKHGGVLHDGEPVLAVTPGKIVKVTTKKQEYTADSVVLCLGPWMKQFCKTIGVDLPLQVRMVKNCYWKAENPEAYSAENGFPLITVDRGPKDYFYGQSMHEYPGMFKFNPFEGTDIESPDGRDAVSNEKSAEILKQMGEVLGKHFKGISTKPAIVETCMFTMTPDKSFILDLHPAHHNIVIGAGFSGHGFKMAPVVGKILAALAMGQNVGYDIETFKLARFPKSSKL